MNGNAWQALALAGGGLAVVTAAVTGTAAAMVGRHARRQQRAIRSTFGDKEARRGR